MSNRLLFSGAVQSAPRYLGRAPRLLSRAAIRAMWRRYRSRQRISELDAHLLKDIGVSFTEAEAEANQPFWRR